MSDISKLDNGVLLSNFYNLHEKINSGISKDLEKRKLLAEEIAKRFNGYDSSKEDSKIDFESLIKVVGVGVDYAPMDSFSPAILGGSRISQIAKEYNDEIDKQKKKRDMIIKTALSVLGVAVKII